jgi:serine protease Do
MKHAIMKRMLIAGIAVITVPAAVLAQDDKDKKEKEKKEMQQIIITRTGDKNDKMVIEVQGDKVTVNGKDVKDLKDANVHVNTIKGSSIHRFRAGQGVGDTWSMNWNDDDRMSLFSEDENRAMLGVVTEGSDKGAEIQSVTKESAAEKAGLKKGDILKQIGDKKIETTDDVTTAVRSHKPGDKVNITYSRDGKEQKATAELGKWKGIKMNAVAAPRILDTYQGFPGNEPMVFNNGVYSLSGRPKLGLSIQDTDDGIGVKVLEVDEESNAAKAGIKKDDVIVGIDDHEIKGTEDVTRLFRTQKEKYTFNFRVKRDGKTQNIELKFPKKLKTADL